MGGDGGSIPRREELVRQRQRPEQRDRNADNAAKWRHCAISQTKLEKPIVACELGRLYSKLAILQMLLDKEKLQDAAFGHIKKLKNVRELVLTKNPAYDQNNPTSSEYICPVTSLEMNGNHRFCFIWTCGCVFSLRALKEINGDKLCFKCGKTFSPTEDVVTLNPTPEELNQLQENRNRRAQSQKVSRKRKDESTTSKLSNPDPPKKKVKPQQAVSQDKRDRVSDKSSAKKRSIQDDPKASATYKSLFTTSSEAKRQVKPHWVTYNPMYFH